MAVIRTVFGDIAPDRAGVTLTHEHVRYAYAGCEYDHRNVWTLDTVAETIAKVMRTGVTEYGIRTLVDLTPPEIGRHPELIAEVARRSDMQIVATTGFYAERMGIPFYWRRKSIDYIAEMMVRDLTEGMVYDNRLTPYRAGTIKVATGGMGPEPTPVGPNGRRIGVYEDRVIRAAGRAQRRIGCSINTHTLPVDYAVTNPALELLDVLEEEGADPGKVIMGHVFIKPQLEQLTALCQRGANLQIDHIGIKWYHPNADALDDQLVDLVCRLTDAGYIDNLLFSYDCFFHHGRGPITEEEPDQDNTKVPIGYLFDNFAPRLAKKGFGKDELRHVLVDNPRRVLAF
jgi:phosphotriesterase-related protein